MSKLFIIINDFYSAVEADLNPKLREKPFVISNGEFIVGVSPPAKRLDGIYLGMPEFLAKEKFPNLLCLKGDMERYRDFSDAFRRKFETIANDVVVMKIGLYALDIRGCPLEKLKTEEAIAQLKKLLEGDNFRAGRAEYFTLAELAARTASPGNMVIIPRGSETAFMSGLPLSFLPLNRNLIKALREMGLKTIGEMLKIPAPVLKQITRNDTGRILKFANGIMSDLPQEMKIIARSLRFSSMQIPPEADFQRAITSIVSEMLDHQLKANMLAVEITYLDSVTVARRLKLAPTNDEVELQQALRFLLSQVWKRRMRLESARIELNLKPEDGQISFWANPQRQKVAVSVQQVRKIYGMSAIRYASVMG